VGKGKVNMTEKEKLAELIANGAGCPGDRNPFGEYCDFCPEELADWLAMGAVTGACIKLGIAPAKCIGFCNKCIEEWLKQPAKEV
jgi:hypothetical protein